jgi:hypothetical protein
MNIPGFTAEASLHQTSEIYRQQSTDIIRSGVGVVPAQCICLRLGGRWQCFCDSGPGVGPLPQ